MFKNKYYEKSEQEKSQLENLQAVQTQLREKGINFFTITWGMKWEYLKTKPYFIGKKRTKKISTILQNTCVVVGEPSNRLCVIDFDTTSDIELKKLLQKIPIVNKTYIVKTVKGYHVYTYLTQEHFTSLSDKATHKIYNTDGFHIGELKIKEGYVIVEGSKHPTGLFYSAYQNEIKDIKTCNQELFKYIIKLINNKTQIEIDRDTKANNIIEEKILNKSLNKKNLTEKQLQKTITGLKQSGLTFKKGSRSDKALKLSLSLYKKGYSIDDAVKIIWGLQDDSDGFSSENLVRYWVVYDWNGLEKKVINFPTPYTLTKKLDGIEFTVKYVNQESRILQDIKDGRNIAIQSPTGSGKTELINSIKDKDVFIVYIGTRIALVKNTANRTGLLIYQGIKTYNYSSMEYEYIYNNDGISVTDKSLHKFIPILKKIEKDKKLIFILDEASKVVENLLKGQNKEAILSIEILQNVKTVSNNKNLEKHQLILFENDIKKSTIDFFEKEITLYKNNYKPQEKNIIFSKTQDKFFEKIYKKSKRGEKVAIYCQTRKSCKLLYNRLSEESPNKNILVVHSEERILKTSNVHNVEKNIKDIKNYDIVIYTGSWSRGVDIQNEDFKEVFGYIDYADITQSEVVQSLKRFRNSKFFILCWLEGYTTKKYKTKDKLKEESLKNYDNLINQIYKNTSNFNKDFYTGNVSDNFVERNKEKLAENSATIENEILTELHNPEYYLKQALERENIKITGEIVRAKNNDVVKEAMESLNKLDKQKKEKEYLEAVRRGTTFFNNRHKIEVPFTSIKSYLNEDYKEIKRTGLYNDKMAISIFQYTNDRILCKDERGFVYMLSLQYNRKKRRRIIKDALSLFSVVENAEIMPSMAGEKNYCGKLQVLLNLIKALTGIEISKEEFRHGDYSILDNILIASNQDQSKVWKALLKEREDIESLFNISFDKYGVAEANNTPISLLSQLFRQAGCLLKTKKSGDRRDRYIDTEHLDEIKRIKDVQSITIGVIEVECPQIDLKPYEEAFKKASKEFDKFVHKSTDFDTG